MKILLFIFVLLTGARGVSLENETPQRMIVEISRGSIVAGKVISQDSETIVIENRNGELITIKLDGISRLVPLVEGGDDVTGTIHLRDGRTLHGIIVLDGFEEVVLQVHAIKLRFSRDQVEMVTIDPPFEETYQQLLQSLDLARPTHLQLFITWLLERNQLDLAQSHLDDSSLSTLEINSLRSRVKVRLRARDHPLTKKPTSKGELDPATSLGYGRALTDEEINLIRAYEVDQHHPPKLLVPQKTRVLIFEKFADDPRLQSGSILKKALLTGSDHDAFRIIRLLHAEEFYIGIQVQEEPDSLRRFSEDVHDAWLINGCGTRGCHGSEGRGRFYLRSKPKNSDQARYANLLMLDRLVIDPKWPLINYDNPAQSLVLQYGLARDLADHPHPSVKNWEPVRKLEQKRVFNAAIAWIRSMRQVPRPKYPIDFPLTTIYEMIEPD